MEGARLRYRLLTAIDFPGDPSRYRTLNGNGKQSLTFI
jgi:hypothetical protein